MKSQRYSSQPSFSRFACPIKAVLFSSSFRVFFFFFADLRRRAKRKKNKLTCWNSYLSVNRQKKNKKRIRKKNSYFGTCKPANCGQTSLRHKCLKSYPNSNSYPNFNWFRGRPNGKVQSAERRVQGKLNLELFDDTGTKNVVKKKLSDFTSAF